MARVVLDANVLISAAFGGVPRRAVRKAFGHEVFVSPDIREELLGLSEELSAKLSPDQISRFRRLMKVLLLKSASVTPNRDVGLCRDSTDNAYLSLCLAAAADYLITGDLDLLSIRKECLAEAGLSHLTITTPRKFLSSRMT